jgi:DNA polymerase III sliding clamp (beta) subunit (PCNA family)
MTTSVTYESAQLADAITKAARVAPSKGAAYDKAAGIVFDVYPERACTVIQATNLDVTYRQVVGHMESSGVVADTRWRLPSHVLAGVMASLPLMAGSTTMLVARGDGAIRLASGRTKARLQMIRNDDYPTVDELDTTDFSDAQELATKVSQVAWACESEKHGDLLAGVHIDGNFLYGTNRYLLAVTECKVPISEPVTVPLSSLTTILKAATEVRCKVGTTPSAVFARFQMALDAETTATARVFDGDYPDVRSRVMRDDYGGHVIFSKRVFTETLSRMMVLARTERGPKLVLKIERDELTLDLEVETGRIQETFVMDDGAGLNEFECTLNPNYIGDAIAVAGTNEVRLDYGPTAMQTLRVSDGEGYECIISPIKPT